MGQLQRLVVTLPRLPALPMGDYQAGVDQVLFDQPIYFADVTELLAATTDVNGSAVVTHGTDTITFQGVSKTTLEAHQNDFHFYFV